MADTRCDCENTTCKLDHLPGDCGNVGMVKTAQGYLCVRCAESMPPDVRQENGTENVLRRAREEEDENS